MCYKQLSWSLACIVAYIVMLTLNYVSTSGAIGSDQTTLSAKYSLPITPPGWTFSIWGLIYLWQALWLFYITYHSIKYKQELQSSDILPFGTVFYISWISSCIFNGSWILFFAYEYITISSIVLILISVALYVNGYINHKYIGLAADKYNSSENNMVFPVYLLNKCTIASYRGLLLNGIAFYGTWTSIAQCLNIAIFLCYVAGTTPNAASLVALGLLTAVILFYWFLDFYYLRKWLNYTYSPYAVLLWALSAISTNPDDGELPLKGATRNWIYALIAMTAVGTVCKIIAGLTFKPKVAEKSEATHVGQYSGVDVEYNAMNEL